MNYIILPQVHCVCLLFDSAIPTSLLIPVFVRYSIYGINLIPRLKDGLVHCLALACYSQENLGINARLNIFCLPFQ